MGQVVKFFGWMAIGIGALLDGSLKATFVLSLGLGGAAIFQRRSGIVEYERIVRSARCSLAGALYPMGRI